VVKRKVAALVAAFGLVMASPSAAAPQAAKPAAVSLSAADRAPAPASEKVEGNSLSDTVLYGGIAVIALIVILLLASGDDDNKTPTSP
jgi:hypothetical protein